MPDERLKYDIMLESSLMAAGDRAFQLQALLKEIKKSKQAEPTSSDLNDQIQWLNKVSTMQGTIKGCLERQRGQCAYLSCFCSERVRSKLGKLILF